MITWSVSYKDVIFHNKHLMYDVYDIVTGSFISPTTIIHFTSQYVKHMELIVQEYYIHTLKLLD